MSEQCDIAILDQGWLAGCDAEFDPCSHGTIRLVLNGKSIAKEDEQYGISESALALLRTLGSSHVDGHRVADRLICHGCGTILMMGCPIGIDFSVHHLNGSVTLSDVVRYDTTSEEEAIRFPGLVTRLPFETYRSIVVGFGLEAKRLFEGATKRFDDDFDRTQYEAFWAEFDELLTRFALAA